MFIQPKNVLLELMSIQPKKTTSQWREYRSCQQWNIKLHSDKQASKIKSQSWSSERAICEDQESSSSAKIAMWRKWTLMS